MKKWGSSVTDKATRAPSIAGIDNRSSCQYKRSYEILHMVQITNKTQ
ncbi:hypothetical protein N473_16295 [Pseudoalteromonas luteoviolacea CPMOR-1]|uniref:Uncharacterized protein n=1 Tax=Pseudoalteromonas luteoviolacea CPMOR-1 TaxID=1365248 RepID=A0A162BL57_9GAMM|nr:hypothetical protein [Pseudoalteromonas luteoviolacea]KZN63724.1 hypothetical protein N473_16295 [Pseudoalteromonas luteoviolacea CPMOR-1]